MSNATGQQTATYGIGATMFNRYYDDHSTNVSDNSGAVTAVAGIVVVGGVLAAASFAFAALLAAVAAMIWALVTGVLGLAAIAATFLIYRERQQTLRAREWRMVEIAARTAGGFPLDAPYYGRQVVDATPAGALPAGQVLVNGRPRQQLPRGGHR